MAAAVLQPIQTLAPENEIMAPSPLSPNASRHGRSKHGGSISKGSKTRGRGYSLVDERDLLISKALAWVLKRTVEEGEGQDDSEEKLVADAEGWVNCEEVLAKPNLIALEATFADVQNLTTLAKPKFSLKLKPNTSTPIEHTASTYMIRNNPTLAPVNTGTTSTVKLTVLSTTFEDLPDLIVYETSYANYPLILASGSIKRAGGQAHLSFKPITLLEGIDLPAVTADVSIYINLREAMEANGKIEWLRSETGAVLTAGDSDGQVSKAFWKKVIARRADIGVLFEDGEVRKEVPIGLRGKGVKPKKGGKGRGKGAKEIKARSEDEDTASD